MKSMSREAFIEATKEAKWATTQEFVDMLNAAGFWSFDFITNAADERKRAYVRRMVRSIKNDDGVPIYANVRTRNEEGTEVQVYKQEEMFGPDDYVQTVTYYAHEARDRYVEALGYKERGDTRYGLDIFLPDPTDASQFGD